MGFVERVALGYLDASRFPGNSREEQRLYRAKYERVMNLVLEDTREAARERVAAHG
jgi:hypothetical protein